MERTVIELSSIEELQEFLESSNENVIITITVEGEIDEESAKLAE